MRPHQKLSATHLLQKVATSEGFPTVMAMLDRYTLDGVVPGICVQCGATIELQCEPDAEDIPCEPCASNTVKSILIIAGII